MILVLVMILNIILNMIMNMIMNMGMAMIYEKKKMNAVSRDGQGHLQQDKVSLEV